MAQKMRFTDKELSLIKSTFADNEGLLKLLRKVFLQIQLSKADIANLSVLTNSNEALALLKKVYAPEIEVEAPLGQVIDLWLSVDSSVKDPDSAVLALKVRQRLMELIQAGLNRVAVPTENPTEVVRDYKPKFSGKREDIYVEFAARNALITHTEFQLNQLNILAGRTEETVEQTKERLMKDSAK